MVAACSLKLWFGATRVQAMVPSINCKDYGRMVAFMTQIDHAAHPSGVRVRAAAEHDRQGVDLRGDADDRGLQVRHPELCGDLR